MKKQELRRFYLAERAARDEALKERLNRTVCKTLLSLPEIKRAPLLLCYAAVRGEIDLTEFYERVGVPLAFPRTFGAGEMEFAVAEPRELVCGRYRIPEPPAEKRGLLCFPEGTVCLVPALAFDAEGYRLGYGGGYYDRFLEDFSGVSVGIADTLTEKLPHGELDLPVSMIVHGDGVKTPKSGKALLW